MNSKTLVMTLAASSVLFAGNVLAGEIYKYTDEDGTVAYVDRPTALPNGEHMAVSSRPTDNAAVQANTQARLAAANDRAAAEAKQKEALGSEELTRSEKRAAEDGRQRECEQYRAQTDSIAAARRLVRMDENGEPIYLSDAEAQEARNELQDYIQQNCG